MKKLSNEMILYINETLVKLRVDSLLVVDDGYLYTSESWSSGYSCPHSTSTIYASTARLVLLRMFLVYIPGKHFGSFPNHSNLEFLVLLPQANVVEVPLNAGYRQLTVHLAFSLALPHSPTLYARPLLGRGAQPAAYNRKRKEQRIHGFLHNLLRRFGPL